MNIIGIFEKIQSFLNNPIVQTIFFMVAGLITLFTPDEIDRVIFAVLEILGIKKLSEVGNTKK